MLTYKNRIAEHLAAIESLKSELLTKCATRRRGLANRLDKKEAVHLATIIDTMFPIAKCEVRLGGGQSLYTVTFDAAALDRELIRKCGEAILLSYRTRN